MKRQRGFGAIAAIVVIVILAGLSAAVVMVGTTQQSTFTQDLLAARAWQAARTGTDWGLFQALQPSGIWSVGAASDLCPAGGSALGNGKDRTTTLDLTATTGFYVTVTGRCWRYNEGLQPSGAVQTVSVYNITAVACPVNGCPATGAAVASPGYIERSRSVVATN
jgi:MSHA biogenesis protein MshP